MPRISEYSEPGDWLDYNAGMSSASSSLPLLREQDLPATEVPPLSPSRRYITNNCKRNNYTSVCSLPAKKVKGTTCKSSINVHTKGMRLPTPCPLPTMFTDEMVQAIANNKIEGIMKLRLER